MLIEKLVCDYLRDTIDVPAYPESPEELPDRYILVEKTGSSRENQIDSATLAVQSIAPSMAEAAELNEEVIGNMDLITALPEVSSCGLNSDYNFTDTETKKYRYQAVFDMTYYR